MSSRTTVGRGTSKRRTLSEVPPPLLTRSCFSCFSLKNRFFELEPTAELGVCGWACPFPSWWGSLLGIWPYPAVVGWSAVRLGGPGGASPLAGVWGRRHQFKRAAWMPPWSPPWMAALLRSAFCCLLDKQQDFKAFCARRRPRRLWVSERIKGQIPGYKGTNSGYFRTLYFIILFCARLSPPDP